MSSVEMYDSPEIKARGPKITQSVSTRVIYTIFKINIRYNLQVCALTTETDYDVDSFYGDLSTSISNNPVHSTVVYMDAKKE